MKTRIDAKHGNMYSRIYIYILPMGLGFGQGITVSRETNKSAGRQLQYLKQLDHYRQQLKSHSSIEYRAGGRSMVLAQKEAWPEHEIYNFHKPKCYYKFASKSNHIHLNYTHFKVKRLQNIYLVVPVSQYPQFVYVSKYNSCAIKRNVNKRVKRRML